MKPSDAVLAFLDAQKIPYRLFTHEPAATMDICASLEARFGFVIPKNYFLAPRNRKHHFVCAVRPDARLVTSELSKQIGSSRLMFAPEEDLSLIGTVPGAVTPLGLVFDEANAVRLLMDESLFAEEALGFHPCDNTMTVRIAVRDLLETFLPAARHQAEKVMFRIITEI